MSKTIETVILSADEFGQKELIDFVRKAGSLVYAVKIHSLFDAYGAPIIKQLKSAGAKKVWVDFKLHDIPNTVKLRAQALAEAGADIISVHASGGVEMMAAAKQGFGQGKVYGITALTSLDDSQIKQIYNSKNAAALAEKLTSLIQQAGLDGLVCSPMEVAMLRSNPIYKHLDIVVPGIRSAGVEASDQKRFDAPVRTLKAGASFLVIGRQITKAEDPLKALELLEQEIQNV